MAHDNTAKRAFSAHLGSKGRSYGLQCPVQRDHCTHNAKFKESLVFPEVKLRIPGGHDLTFAPQNGGYSEDRLAARGFTGP